MAQSYTKWVHILKNQKCLLGMICVQKKISLRQYGLKVRQKNAELTRISALGFKPKQSIDAGKESTHWISSMKKPIKGIISESLEQMMQ